MAFADKNLYYWTNKKIVNVAKYLLQTCNTSQLKLQFYIRCMLDVLWDFAATNKYFFAFRFVAVIVQQAQSEECILYVLILCENPVEPVSTRNFCKSSHGHKLTTSSAVNTTPSLWAICTFFFYSMKFTPNQEGSNCVCVSRPFYKLT